MAQELKQTTVNTFVRGLVTEASPLTFPKDASVDELNCVLERTGVRSRRKGIEQETGASLSTFTVADNELVHTETWENVANIAGVEFLVVQHGDTLNFYNKSSIPVSNGIKSFSVDLNTFAAGNGEDVSTNAINADSVNGFLVVVSNAVNPFYIEYNPDADTITTTEITIRVRDFEWQGDTSTYYEEVAVGSVSEGRKYDTYNSGWVDQHDSTGGSKTVLDEFVDGQGVWPPLTHPWFSGKGVGGEFGPNLWSGIYAGTSLSGNGHFVLELFRKDRTQAVIDNEDQDHSVVLPVEVESSRFTAVSRFAGRVWYAGLSGKKNGSRVYFSQVIQGTEDLGKCFQQGDPTSEDAPDLVDSDGGMINIPSSSSIRALFEWGNSLLVFAENGVWEIAGVDGIFKATEFFVNRVRGADGIVNPKTLIDAEGVPVWWATTGIYTVKKDEASLGSFGSDLSKETIQTFWNEIGAGARSRATGIYDRLNKQIYWLYEKSGANEYQYNKVLILDLVLQAFVPWEFADETSATDYVVGAAYFTGFGSQEVVFDVVSSGGTDDVVSSSGTDDVVSTQDASSVDGPTEIRFLVRDGDTNKLTFATISEGDFKDWGSADFSSFAETGHDFEDDLSTRKNNVYVTCYFNLTETGFTGDETNGYDFIDPSGCLLKSFWDLRRFQSSSQQVYRHLRPIIVDKDDLSTFDYPWNSIITRNKVRGRGRVLRLRFESETGKDFQLQGYEVINAKNKRL